jgi:putative transcriptional regulator
MRELSQGKLLVADPFLHDPHFARSVVFLAAHDADGSFGLVLNRPTEVRLDDVLPEFSGLNLVLYSGGPVEPDTLHYLHATRGMVEGAQAVTDSLSWGGDWQHLVELMRTGRLLPSQIRFFSGYSGWGGEQLAQEIAEQAWFITPAKNEYILSNDAELLWKRVMTDMGEEYAMLTNAPVDPRWN